MPFDLRPLFKLSFWFELNPPPISALMAWVLLVGFILMAVAGIVLRVLSRRKSDRYLRETFLRIGRMLITIGILSLVWFFFHFEQIRFFGARFWLLAWLLVALLWTALIVRFVKQETPALRSRDERRKHLDKYLPRKKR